MIGNKILCVEKKSGGAWSKIVGELRANAKACGETHICICYEHKGEIHTYWWESPPRLGDDVIARVLPSGLTMTWGNPISDTVTT